MNSPIILGEEQLSVIESINNFLLSKETSITISGYAGTGKSSIILEIVKNLKKWIPRKEYVLCAPTHKAKLVLERFSGESGVTLHKLLSLSPNIEILNLDFRDLQFRINTLSTLFPIDGVIICDEASMINDVLYDELINNCIKLNSKIIFIGDIKQLAPVNANSFSKVFSNNTLYLSKIYRQSDKNGLHNVLPTLREHHIVKFVDSIGEEGSLICVNNIKDLFVKAIPEFKKAIKNSDILQTKILAYTNNRVQALNMKARELLFGKEKEYCKFEFLTAYENLKFNGTEFWNSMDYIIIDEPTPININIPYFISLPGYKLNLYNSSEDCSEEINILSKEISQDYLQSLAYSIETIRLEAIMLKKRYSKNAGNAWKKYYQMIESFTSPFDLFYDNRVIRKKSFDYGYAMTIHRSQGSSINNVFIDMKDVAICKNTEELRQLQYVSVSRAMHDVVIFQ